MDIAELVHKIFDVPITILKGLFYVSLIVVFYKIFIKRDVS